MADVTSWHTYKEKKNNARLVIITTYDFNEKFLIKILKKKTHRTFSAMAGARVGEEGKEGKCSPEIHFNSYNNVKY